MLPGAVGSRWMPRKMAGIAMITIEASIVAIVMLRVVLESATHLYRSPVPDGEVPAGGCWPCPGVIFAALRTMINDTAKHLLNRN